jgi:GT2 family glycosyltransferase
LRPIIFRSAMSTSRSRVEHPRCRAEAENWRRETARHLAWREKRLSRRLRRSAFRIARRIWRVLPRALRDFLRPFIVPGAQTWRSASPPWVDPPRSPRPHAPARRARPSPPRQIDAPVSVVVPTLDGGGVFARLLRSVCRQEGVHQLELVVIDSGSTDETLELAERAKARIVSIPQREFGHGRTRNQAAALATGEVLVMMVQDAVLLGRTALRDLVLELNEDDRIAAVSSRQIPRSDADLYAAFVVYAHYGAIWGAKRRPHAIRALSPLQRRAAATVDHVCAAVRRAAWEQIQFSDIDFAEDLDFGLRAVERGWSVKLSQTAAVAHSHTRDPLYHLRRSIADRLYVAPLVGDWAVSLGGASGVGSVLAAGSTLLSEVQGAMSLALAEQAPLVHQLADARRLLESGAPRLPPAAAFASLASMLGAEGLAVDGEATLGHLRRELVGVLEWPPLTAFARAQRHVSAEPASGFVASLSASVLGRAIGDALRAEADSQRTAQFIAGV